MSHVQETCTRNWRQVLMQFYAISCARNFHFRWNRAVFYSVQLHETCIRIKLAQESMSDVEVFFDLYKFLVHVSSASVRCVRYVCSSARRRSHPFCCCGALGPSRHRYFDRSTSARPGVAIYGPWSVERPGYPSASSGWPTTQARRSLTARSWKDMDSSSVALFT